MNADQSHKKRLKLEDISKKESFSVPDDYFDKLPTIIQSRAIESTKKWKVFTPVGTMRLALPALLIILLAGYFGYKYQNNRKMDDSKIEAMLAEVSTEQLVNYLSETDLTSDDLLQMVSFEGESLEDFSTSIDDLSDDDLELLNDEFDFENENSI